MPGPCLPGPRCPPSVTLPGAESYPATIFALAPPEQVSLLREAATSAVDEDDEDFFAAELDFGLRTILDGIQELVSREERGRR